jgi:hypothetical protein
MSLPRHAWWIPALALGVGAPPPVRAEGFSTTNIQALQGFSFDDKKLGYDTQSGAMTTVTLNHFLTWEYGDSFFFADLYTGNFKNGNPPTGSIPGATLYAEWHPRLFVNQLFGVKGNVLGIFRNIGIAAEINQGANFYAYLAGVGVDFALPFPYSVGLNVYYRYDRFDRHEWQLSPFWNLPFTLGPLALLFSGFVDIAGTRDLQRNQAIDVMAQPELLLDVLALFHGKGNRLYVGVEWYVHHYPSGVYGPENTTSAPQIMVQWVLF